jgi:DNA-binding SARP family transcriptional activator
MRRIEVRLLGRFEVLVDSRSVPAEAWAQRRATDLVKVLALAPGHRMPRDEVLEMLWPKLGPDAAAAN